MAEDDLLRSLADRILAVDADVAGLFG